MLLWQETEAISEDKEAAPAGQEGVVDLEPGLPESLLGDLLWLLLGGRERLGEAEIIPSEMVRWPERACEEGRVL